MRVLQGQICLLILASMCHKK
uniref:Uncharacterized protein n=1 Tax=Arundo donax TaxID=35708 RepID=A0A0A9ATW9_ARUDO